MAYKLTDIATPEKLLITTNELLPALDDSVQFLAATLTLSPNGLLIEEGTLIGVTGTATAITVPNTVTAVGDKALRYTNITSVTFAGAAPPAFGAEWAPPNLTKIVVPEGSIMVWELTLPDFTDIIEEVTE